ncbi:hypothetical protein ACFSNO_25365 [Streptomyces cirratus]
MPALVNRALCALELGEEGEARADAAEALRRDPGHPPARYADRLVRTLLRLADTSPLPVGLVAAEHGLRVRLRTYDRPSLPTEVGERAELGRGPLHSPATTAGES